MKETPQNSNNDNAGRLYVAYLVRMCCIYAILQVVIFPLPKLVSWIVMVWGGIGVLVVTLHLHRTTGRPFPEMVDTFPRTFRFLVMAFGWPLFALLKGSRRAQDQGDVPLTDRKTNMSLIVSAVTPKPTFTALGKKGEPCSFRHLVLDFSFGRHGLQVHTAYEYGAHGILDDEFIANVVLDLEGGPVEIGMKDLHVDEYGVEGIGIVLSRHAVRITDPRGFDVSTSCEISASYAASERRAVLLAIQGELQGAQALLGDVPDEVVDVIGRVLSSELPIRGMPTLTGG